MTKLLKRREVFVIWINFVCFFYLYIFQRKKLKLTFLGSGSSSFWKFFLLLSISSNNFFFILLKLVASLVIPDALLHFRCRNAAWKESKYGAFSGPFFSVFGLDTEIYGVNLRIQSEYRKIRTRKNTVLGHFLRSVTHKEWVYHRVNIFELTGMVYCNSSSLGILISKAKYIPFLPTLPTSSSPFTLHVETIHKMNFTYFATNVR